MKTSYLCCAVMGGIMLASNAMAVTLGYTAQRTFNSEGGPAGSAIEFVSNPAREKIHGTISYDPAAALLRSEPILDQSTGIQTGTEYVFEGPTTITVNQPGAAAPFVFDSLRFDPLSGEPLPLVLVDSDPFPNQTSDLMVIGNDRPSTSAVALFGNDAATFLDGPIIPTDFVLSELDTARILFLERTAPGSGPGAISIYEITSVAAVPLPASALLLLVGLAGLGAAARRKTAA